MNNSSDIASDASDIALSTILEAASEVCPTLPKEVIEAIFQIQKNHVFTSDRSIPLYEMQKYLENYVTNEIGK